MEAGDLDHFLCLCHGSTVSGLLLSRLLERFGSFHSLVNSGADQLAELGLTTEQVKCIVDVECDRRSETFAATCLDWAAADDQQLVTFDSPAYPRLLREISAPPPLLFLKGKAEAITSLNLAIVGSRKCTPYGKQNAFWIAAELARAGLSICSGLARGIDTEAHRGALQVDGMTVAVLGTGIDICYPRANSTLAQQISCHGAIVSEFALGQGPRPHQFPQRNRIISGLSVATLIVEADEQSGSLITARLAMEQNREVLAIPGPINSRQSLGCHRFIKQGAALVSSPEDIMTLLVESGLVPMGNRPAEKLEKSNPVDPLPPRLQQVLQAIDHAGVIADRLASELELPWQELHGTLLELEVMDRIYRLDGRYYRREDGLHR